MGAGVARRFWSLTRTLGADGAGCGDRIEDSPPSISPVEKKRGGVFDKATPGWAALAVNRATPAIAGMCCLLSSQ